MKTTIFFRILLATFIPLLIVFVVIIATISNILYANQILAAKKTLTWESTNISRNITRNVNNVKNTTSYLHKQLENFDYTNKDAKKTLERIFKELLKTNDSILHIWVAYEANVFSHSSKPWTLSAIQESQQASHDNKHINNTFAHLPEDVIDTTSIKLFSGNIFIGTLHTEICYQNIFSNVRTQLSKKGHFALIAQDGEIIQCTATKNIKGNFFALPTMKDEQMENAIKDVEVYLSEAIDPFTERKSLIGIFPATTSLNNMPLYLYMSAPLNDINATADSSVTIIISTSVFAIFLLGFSVFIATRSIVRPIKKITRDFDQISHGNLEIITEDATHEKSRIYELNILQNSLETMLNQLQQVHALRMQATEEQLEKEKVLAASKAKSQFFANMSHEIRTPMNAILGISEILLHGNNLPEKERKYVGDIKISSEKLLVIINDILDISRLESNKLTLVNSNFDFHAFLQNLQSMGDFLAKPNNLTFIFDIVEPIPTTLYGDETRLQQIFLNIISNACKFTKEGNVSIRIYSKDGLLHFVIKDSGYGISEEGLKTLFDPFVRVGGSATEAIQGAGLGLAITKNLIDMMEGNIRVESALHEGTTFYISIPEVLGNADELSTQKIVEHANYKEQNFTVLIVDDNEINLCVAEGLLTELYGLTCDLANSGEMALEKVTSNDYALIFMDQMMPFMDGIETTKRIRDLGGKWAHIPIIALTANAISGTREQLLDVGMNDYLTKPIDVEAMGSILQKWLPKKNT